MTTPKTGPLTQGDLQAIWESTTDPGFWQPLEQAGEGQGFEAYTQAFAQHARVSTAIDVTTQAMFILPWSGQSNPSARGAQNAGVSLTLMRSGALLSMPLTIAAGTFVEELEDDWSYSGSVPTKTGRRFALNADAVFPPGFAGPLQVGATAEFPGYGYNNPQPGSITLVDQVGTGYTNGGASVVGSNYPNPAISPQVVQAVYVVAANIADAFLPDHVGQYVQFTAGANAGATLRAVGYLPPNLQANPPNGGTLQLELSQAVVSDAGHVTGTFVVGEALTFADHTAAVTGYGRLLGITFDGAGNASIVVLKSNGKISTTAADLGHATITGQLSGAVAIVDLLHFDAELVAESGTASWRILDWVADWGLLATNPLQPQGGRLAMLDALGKERNIQRRTGEGDPAYASRVAAVADVVSPNAILRTINRVAVGAGFADDYEFLEAGLSYPGFYFDKDAYDLDAQYIPPGSIQTGKFFGGEKVMQLLTPVGYSAPQGTVALGRALVDGSGNLVGVAGIWGTFGFALIVGEQSGATVSPAGPPTGGLLPGDKQRVYFDYEDMRAWFYVLLPGQFRGDDGFAYDVKFSSVGSPPFVNAWDVELTGGGAPFAEGLNFYDGGPWVDALSYLQLWGNLQAVRAGGVGVTFEPLV